MGCALIIRYGTKIGNNIKILEDQSFLDGLTLIYNRRFFDETLKKALLISKRNKVPLSLAICDIDNFKFYNDAYGHPAGDDCLKKVAHALKNVVQRPADLVARYGGEEFGIILPNTDRDGANVVANLLVTKIESLQIPHKASLVNKYVTISVGVATVTGENVDMITFIDHADQALYKAKLSGKNCSAEYFTGNEAGKDL
jgi:diguanylate cyclase (GGDEF)-like protein